MTLKVVIFDFDGTLAILPTDYTRMRERLAVLFRENGFDAEFGPILETIEEGVVALTPTLGSARIMNLKRRALAIVAEEEVIGSDSATPMPFVMDVMSDLAKREIPWGIVTRNHSACVRNVMARFAFPEPVRLVARDHVTRAKPDPEGARLILKDVRAHPHETLVVGDTYHDVVLGKRIQARTVLIEHPGARPVTEEPDWRVKGLDEVLAIVDGLASPRT